MPSSRRNARAKLRSLMCARSASAGTERSASRLPGDPLLQLAQRLALGGLRGELGAELRLPAGALHEQHEPARDLERRRAAEVLLDQREREVHAGGDAGGGVESPSRTKIGSRSTRHVRVALGEAVAARPSGWWRGGRRAARPRRARRRRCRPSTPGASAPRPPATHDTVARSRAAVARRPGRPATISVSIGPRQLRKRAVGRPGRPTWSAPGRARRATISTE